MTDERFHEIDIAVEDAGFSYDPISETFLSSDPAEADNNLSFEWHTLSNSLPGITREEFAEYVSRKQEEGEKEMEQYMPPDSGEES
jgi:hypothetical protein